jgi:hypothetical protein
VSFGRLLRADMIAAVAAVVLLFVMALDWYSTVAGKEARRIEALSQPEGAVGGEPERRIQEEARFRAEDAEKNAWQVSGALDRVILLGMLVTVLLTLGAAFLRAAPKRSRSRSTPSALAALSAILTAVLVAYRSVDEPGFDEATTVESGLPLALVVLGVIALSCQAAMREHERGRLSRSPPPPPA